ncbi:MAG TPA: NYN domain-containing protein [Mycobacterium sp.]|nr:NYN domain-containing protein [Mycobacterium sp.]
MHWIVDGMNVIGCRPDGWWRNRQHAMAALVDKLERWSVGAATEVTVVFEQPPKPPLRSMVITVTHAPAAAPNSADDEIVRLVCSAEDPAAVRVATSDRALADRVRAAGASVFPAEAMRSLVDPG